MFELIHLDATIEEPQSPLPLGGLVGKRTIGPRLKGLLVFSVAGMSVNFLQKKVSVWLDKWCRNWLYFVDYWDYWYDQNVQYRSRLYPFCETLLDVAASEEPTFLGAGFPLNVNFKIPFIGVAYSSLYVSRILSIDVTYSWLHLSNILYTYVAFM